MDPNFQTLLTLSAPGGVTLYSARGLKQTLTPIGAQRGNVRRTINMTLIDLTPPGSRKYASEISCSDVQAPKLDGLWVGERLIVGCVAELAFRTLTETPGRPEISGSSRVVGDFTVYRPLLSMRVMDFSEEIDEWQRQVGWKLSLEEE